MHIIYSLTSGGAEVLVSKYAESLAKGGRYRPVVCAWRRGGPIKARLDASGIRVHVCNLRRRRFWTGPLFLADLLRIRSTLLKIARAERVGLVHAHLNDSTLLGVMVARAIGCPVIATVHSNHLIPTNLKPGSMRRWFWSRLYRWSLMRCSRVVSASGTVKSRLNTILDIPLDRVTTITNGVDPPPPLPQSTRQSVRAELGIGAGDPVIVFIGRLVPGKNQAALLDMMPTILRHLPAARLVLVGDGPSEGALRNHAARLNLGSAVVFAGGRPSPYGLLAAADAFVTASVTEGISLAVLEAMDAGVPIVALKSEGNDETLADNAGLVVDSRDPRVLGAAALSVLTDPALAAELRAAARRRVDRFYRLDRVMTELTTLYDQQLARTGSSN